MPSLDPAVLLARGIALGNASKTHVTDGVNACLPNALFNDINNPVRAHVRQRERPEHRLMICMAANGFNITEIAEKSGYSAQAVSSILREPWARARIIGMQQEVGMDELQRTIRQGASGAIARIRQRAENDQVDPGVRERADEYLANRYLGKPKEQVEHTHKPVDKLSDSELTAIIEQGLQVAGEVGEIELKVDGAGAA